VSVAAFVASQRTTHGVPHVVTCRALDVSESWFYKWRNGNPTARGRRRGELDAAVQAAFEASGGTYGSPRLVHELRAQGWRVGENTVAESMTRQGLVARPRRRCRGLTRPDRRAVPFADLVARDFTAAAPNRKWCGDMTDIPTGDGPLYLASVEDLYSRRLLGFAMSEHPDAALATASLHMAVAVRGGSVAGVIFHTDRGSTYTAESFTRACAQLHIRQSMGRVGSCLDNAAAESFFSTLEHEVLSRHRFATREQARRYVAAWIDRFYNRQRRHSRCQMMSPTDYEHAATAAVQAA
jgi:putative transposase